MNNKATILYVEDEQNIRDGLSPILNFLSDELYTAVDGEDGLDQYKKHKPDIVISDIKMPKMNGIEMVKAIKSINNKQHILFTTAHSESNFFMEAIESHVDGYVLKPIDLDILEEHIEAITEQITIKKKFEKQQTIIEEISSLQDNLLLVVDKFEKIIFLNNKCLKFFNIKNIDEFNKKHSCISSLFMDNNESSFSNTPDLTSLLKKIESLKDNERIVSMLDMDSSETKEFLISVKKIIETSHTILTFSEITNIAIEKNLFEQKAFKDELTTIYNRAYFNQELEKQISIYKEKKELFSLIIFDIDKFKDFNDTYGHQIGDDILKGLSKIVDKHTRDTDTFARWGGEEFVIILLNSSLKDAYKVAQHLRKIIQKHNFINDLHVTCSFGVSQYVTTDDEKTLLKRADEALYLAKLNGRNRVESKSLETEV